jgi:hypothetical protein
MFSDSTIKRIETIITGEVLMGNEAIRFMAPNGVAIASGQK